MLSSRRDRVVFDQLLAREWVSSLHILCSSPCWVLKRPTAVSALACIGCIDGILLMLANGLRVHEAAKAGSVALYARRCAA
jgi:hypothetical protein